MVSISGWSEAECHSGGCIVEQRHSSDGGQERGEMEGGCRGPKLSFQGTLSMIEFASIRLHLQNFLPSHGNATG